MNSRGAIISLLHSLSGRVGTLEVVNASPGKIPVGFPLRIAQRDALGTEG